MRSYYPPYSCVQACPNAFLTDGQVHALTIVTAVLGHVALFSCLVVLVAYATHPWRSRFPRSTPGWLFVPLTSVTLSRLMGVWVGWETYTCDRCGDPNNGYTWIGCWFSHWSWCWLGGWLGYWGGLSTAVWYSLVALSIFLSLSRKTRLPWWLGATMFQLLGNGTALIPLVAIALTDNLKPTGNFFPCLPDVQKVREYHHRCRHRGFDQ